MKVRIELTRYVEVEVDDKYNAMTDLNTPDEQFDELYEELQKDLINKGFNMWTEDCRYSGIEQVAYVETAGGDALIEF